jgi:hypothetical protein
MRAYKLKFHRFESLLASFEFHRTGSKDDLVNRTKIINLLHGFIVAAAVASLIVAVKLGICQHNSGDTPSRSGTFVSETWCSDVDVVVLSKDPQDSLLACEGARDAIVFLRSYDLVVADNMVIELLRELPAEVSSSTAGCYLESERRMLILIYSEFRKFKTWFGIPIDRSLYRSVVSHEVAHLVADLNFTVSKPSIQAKEYIAYITQFSTMEPSLLERVLSNFACKAFEGDWQMSTTIYMFDCMGFGVRAYRHFLNLTDSDEYLHAIINGEALIE